MTTRLIPCPSCARLFRATDSQCPHCETKVSSDATAGVAVVSAIVMGLTLAGCGGDDSDSGGDVTSAQTTISTSATQGTQSTGDATSDDSATSTSAGDVTDTNMPTTAQPPYGVPDTGTTTPPTSDDGSTSDSGSSSGTAATDDTTTGVIEPPYGVGTT